MLETRDYKRQNDERREMSSAKEREGRKEVVHYTNVKDPGRCLAAGTPQILVMNPYIFKCKFPTSLRRPKAVW
jgi:hypothetical protein